MARVAEMSRASAVSPEHKSFLTGQSVVWGPLQCCQVARGDTCQKQRAWGVGVSNSAGRASHLAEKQSKCAGEHVGHSVTQPCPALILVLGLCAAMQHGIHKELLHRAIFKDTPTYPGHTTQQKHTVRLELQRKGPKDHPTIQLPIPQPVGSLGFHLQAGSIGRAQEPRLYSVFHSSIYLGVFRKILNEDMDLLCCSTSTPSCLGSGMSIAKSSLAQARLEAVCVSSQHDCTHSRDPAARVC